METNKSYESELLGCPFCGGTARFVIAFGREAVACTGCLAVMRSMRLDDDRTEIVAEWNRRQPLEITADQVDALAFWARDLKDIQNGPPLIRDTVDWNKAMDGLEKALEPFEANAQISGGTPSAESDCSANNGGDR